MQSNPRRAVPVDRVSFFTCSIEEGHPRIDGFFLGFFFSELTFGPIGLLVRAAEWPGPKHDRKLIIGKNPRVPDHTHTNTDAHSLEVTSCILPSKVLHRSDPVDGPKQRRTGLGEVSPTISVHEVML